VSGGLGGAGRAHFDNLRPPCAAGFQVNGQFPRDDGFVSGEQGHHSKNLDVSHDAAR
jgi:hypothetical protein